MRWFKHMAEAADDEKLAEVLDIHGAGGYGVFWLIVEAVARQMDGKNTKCEVRYSQKKWTRIAHVDYRTLAKYLQTFSNLTLIVQHNYEKFVTISIPKLLELRDEYSRKSGQSTTQNQEQELDTDTDTDTEEKKVIKKRFSPPSFDDVKTYCSDRGNNVDHEMFIDFYEAKGWMVGKNKMKNWKAAVRTWEKNTTDNKTATSQTEKGHAVLGEMLRRCESGKVDTSGDNKRTQPAIRHEATRNTSGADGATNGRRMGQVIDAEFG